MPELGYCPPHEKLIKFSDRLVPDSQGNIELNLTFAPGISHIILNKWKFEGLVQTIPSISMIISEGNLNPYDLGSNNKRILLHYPGNSTATLASDSTLNEEVFLGQPSHTQTIKIKFVNTATNAAVTFDAVQLWFYFVPCYGR